MFESIIRFSLKYKFLVFILVAGIAGMGVYSLNQIPVDAVPDITNNQVQVVTVSPSLAPQEVEQLITFPVEVAVANIPDVIEIRSISRYGLSVVTIVFKDKMPILDARQYVKEQIALAEAEIPDGLGNPELMPITTGLGEIYQYTLEVDPEYREYYDPMKLRTIQDWIVKRQLSGIPGIIEVSSFGGYLKQYEVAVDPMLLRSFNLTLSDVFDALEANNQNSGGSYIEKSTNAYYIRTEGRVNSTAEIEKIVIAHKDDVPVFIRDIGNVGWGSPKRYGAMTRDGNGEAVGGITLMFKGANSSEAIQNVKDRIAKVQESLPMGVKIAPYLDRSDLVGRAIKTVRNNLVEGGLIVIFVLILLLGHWRAGLVVASIIPLSLLFAFIMMNIFGVSANLMSLGALDFGIVVDGAVIIVENILHTLYSTKLGKKLSQREMDDVIEQSSTSIYKSAAFGVLIILVVFLPILSLTGIEGKMFKPMALTVSFAILGAMLLSMTYVPVISSLILSKKIKSGKNISDQIITLIRRAYLPVLTGALRYPFMILSLALALFLGSLVVFGKMGSEFIPTLEEGDLAMQMTIQPGSSLQESIATSTRAEKILMDKFPEVNHVVSKIGTAEVPTDPMAIEDADIMIILKNKSEWTSASDREELVELMKKELDIIVGASFEFTQPIQLRFNELMTGAKTDIAVKIFGENTEELAELGHEAAAIIETIEGAGDVRIEQTEGLPQLLVKVDRNQLARYHLDVEDVNQTIRTAYAGESSGVVFEEEKKFDLVVRLKEEYRKDLELHQLFIPNPNGVMVPLNEIASTQLIEGPMQISREDAKRRIVVGVNVRNRDVASLVEEIEQKLNSGLNLPAGYFITYGGQFENLQAARDRLIIAVPIALFLIFIFLFSAFRSLKYSLMIFSAVPLSAIGGIFSLWIRGMPFSISAGVGFIALFGVAVLNGIVLISFLNDLKDKKEESLYQIIVHGSLSRLRPVIMTASVAALGFFPMALSSTAGAEVQKPLATVVIGGLVSSTFLTLIVLPALYLLINQKNYKVNGKALMIGLFILFLPSLSYSQPATLTREAAVQKAIDHHSEIKSANLEVEKAKLEKGKTFDPGPLNFEYQRGNINSFFDDYHWQLTQPLGNPIQAIQAGKAQENRVDIHKYLLELKVREIRNLTENTWIDWYIAGRKLEALQLLRSRFDTIELKIKMALDAGEINALTLQLWNQSNQSIRQQYVTASLEYQKSWSRLQTWCNLTGHYDVPKSSEPYILQDSLSLSDTFVKYFGKIVDVSERDLMTAKAAYFPELMVGYFEQQIDGVTGLNGWRAGISIPIWFVPNNKNIQQTKLSAQQAGIHADFQLNRYYNELQNLILVQQNLSGLLDEPIKIQPIIDELNEGLSVGELNYFEYLSTLNITLENFINQLDIQSEYMKNQSRIQFLTK